MRYTPEKKAAILAAAKKNGLTGEQVEKKFGVVKATFYRWRGPVREKRRVVGSKITVTGGTAELRQLVREYLNRTLPGIVREEMDALLKT